MLRDLGNESKQNVLIHKHLTKHRNWTPIASCANKDIRVLTRMMAAKEPFASRRVCVEDCL